MPGMNGQGSGGGCRRTGGQGMGRGRGMGQGAGMRQGRRQGMKAEAGPANTGMNMDVRKIAVSSEGPTMESRVDPRFGRCGGFAVVDLTTMSVEYVDNGSSQALGQGAGIQAAETVANAGAQVLLSGYVGPKAFTALKAAGVLVGQDVDGMTVGEAIEKYKRGEVDMAESPNAQAGGN